MTMETIMQITIWFYYTRCLMVNSCILLHRHIYCICHVLFPTFETDKHFQKILCFREGTVHN